MTCTILENSAARMLLLVLGLILHNGLEGSRAQLLLQYFVSECRTPRQLRDATLDGLRYSLNLQYHPHNSA